MDKNTEIVELLQSDLKGELQGIRQYIQGAQVARGMMGEIAADILQETAEDEMHHYATLGKLIVAYGGIPDTSDPLPVIEDPSINESMQIGIRLETATIAQYAAHRDRFQELGEHGLVQAIESIIDEEQSHLTAYTLRAE